MTLLHMLSSAKPFTGSQCGTTPHVVRSLSTALQLESLSASIRIPTCFNLLRKLTNNASHEPSFLPKKAGSRQLIAPTSGEFLLWKFSFCHTRWRFSRFRRAELRLLPILHSRSASSGGARREPWKGHRIGPMLNSTLTE